MSSTSTNGSSLRAVVLKKTAFSPADSRKTRRRLRSLSETKKSSEQLSARLRGLSSELRKRAASRSASPANPGAAAASASVSHVSGPYSPKVICRASLEAQIMRQFKTRSAVSVTRARLLRFKSRFSKKCWAIRASFRQLNAILKQDIRTVTDPNEPEFAKLQSWLKKFLIQASGNRQNVKAFKVAMLNLLNTVPSSALVRVDAVKSLATRLSVELVTEAELELAKKGRMKFKVRGVRKGERVENLNTKNMSVFLQQLTELKHHLKTVVKKRAQLKELTRQLDDMMHKAKQMLACKREQILKTEAKNRPRTNTPAFLYVGDLKDALPRELLALDEDAKRFVAQFEAAVAPGIPKGHPVLLPVESLRIFFFQTATRNSMRLRNLTQSSQAIQRRLSSKAKPAVSALTTFLKAVNDYATTWYDPQDTSVMLCQLRRSLSSNKVGTLPNTSKVMQLLTDFNLAAPQGLGKRQQSRLKKVYAAIAHELRRHVVNKNRFKLMVSLRRKYPDHYKKAHFSSVKDDIAGVVYPRELLLMMSYLRSQRHDSELMQQFLVMSQSVKGTSDCSAQDLKIVCDSFRPLLHSCKDYRGHCRRLSGLLDDVIKMNGEYGHFK